MTANNTALGSAFYKTSSENSNTTMRTRETPSLDDFTRRIRSLSQLRSLLLRVVLDIEDSLSRQLNVIIEAQEFQELEARWMGLATVVWSKPETDYIKIKVLDMSWDEICRDLHYTSEIRRSRLYSLLCCRELDTLGGEPFGIAMIDHDLSMCVEAEFDELNTVQLVCSVAEASLCPIILGVGNEFFGETDAAWYTDARRITSVLNSEEFYGWQALRKLPNARFIGLIFAQTHLRGRYEDADIGFRFHQRPSESIGLWASGCYDFLRTIIAEYHRCAWFGFLKLVSNEQGVGAVLSPTQHPIPKACVRTLRSKTRLTRDLASTYSSCGFVPLAESTKSNKLYFFGNRSIADCQGMDGVEIVTQLQSVLIACRIVHYIKIQSRTLIGRVKTASECERILNEWLDPYVSPSSASVEVQARFPLQAARIEIAESTLHVGRFQCRVVIRPQYQIDNVLEEIELKTDIDVGGLNGDH